MLHDGHLNDVLFAHLAPIGYVDVVEDMIEGVNLVEGGLLQDRSVVVVKAVVNELDVLASREVVEVELRSAEVVYVFDDVVV